MKKYETESPVKAAFTPRLELLGNTSCIAEGIKGIISCNEDLITLDLGKQLVSFYGDGLCISSFSSDGAEICGTIVSVEFGSNG